MPEMIAKTLPKYGERKLSPGDRFNADQQYVAMLVASGSAELAPAQAGPGGYETRDMAAGEPGAYRTRDVQSAPRAKHGSKRRTAA